MSREGMTLLGFETVTYAGNARSKLLEALKAAEDGDFARTGSLVVEARSCIAEAHSSYIVTLVREAPGEELPHSVTMICGQDHLMTTVLSRDVIHHLTELYKREIK